MLAKGTQLLVKAFSSELEALKWKLEACSPVRKHSLAWGKASRFLEKAYSGHRFAFGLYLRASKKCMEV